MLSEIEKLMIYSVRYIFKDFSMAGNNPVSDLKYSETTLLLSTRISTISLPVVSFVIFEYITLMQIISTNHVLKLTMKFFSYLNIS